MLESAQHAARLSEVRFKAGTTDYFEVLINETNSFSAELATNHATDSVATFLNRSLHGNESSWLPIESGAGRAGGIAE
jgi:hypothetical protein